MSEISVIYLTKLPACSNWKWTATDSSETTVSSHPLSTAERSSPAGWSVGSRKRTDKHSKCWCCCNASHKATLDRLCAFKGCIREFDGIFFKSMRNFKLFLSTVARWDWGNCNKKYSSNSGIDSKKPSNLQQYCKEVRIFYNDIGNMLCNSCAKNKVEFCGRLLSKSIDFFNNQNLLLFQSFTVPWVSLIANCPQQFRIKSSYSTGSLRVHTNGNITIC